MKKLLLVTLFIGMIGCIKPGEISQQSQDIKINNKVYKLVKIVPADGDRSIWIMYPKDTADKMPTVLNYDVQENKTTRNQSIIKID